MDGVRVIRVPALNPIPRRLVSDKMFFMIDYLPASFRPLIKEYDIIHFHNDLSLCFPFFSYSVNKPKIFHCHCLNTTYPMYARNFISRYLFNKSASLYVAVSKWMVDLLRDLSIPSERIKVVYNGVDTNKFTLGNQEKKEDTILFVGRLTPVKGLSTLLRALDHITRRVSLQIVGPIPNIQYANELRILANKVASRAGHDIEFLGVQPEEELVGLYQRASFLAMPSLSDPFPVVGLEALSCGTPVVASSVGGIPEYIENGKNGFLVPPTDPTKLAQAIQHLLDDRKLRMRFGKEGRRLVEEKFSAHRMIQNLLDIYTIMSTI
jgi:glycosyltransferase involved in cell wall biosynthesis